MITDIAIFIQFIGALFVTMTLESTITYRFWNPDFNKLVKDNIDKYIKNVPKSTDINNTIESFISSNSKNIELKTRKIGLVFLLYSIFLMIMIVYEGLLIDKNLVVFCCALFLSGIYLVILLIGSNSFLKQWWSVLLHFCIVLFLFIISLVFLPKWTWFIDYIQNKDWSKNLGIIIQSGIILLLLLPIFKSILYNLIYSRWLVFYLADEFKKEETDYQNTINILQRKDPNVDLPEPYKKVYADVYCDKTTDVNNDSAEIYIKRLLSKFDNLPKPRKIIIFMITNKIHNIFKKKNNQLSEGDSGKGESFEFVPKMPDAYVQSVIKAIEEYEKVKDKISIVAFCKNKHINISDFRAIRNYKRANKKIG